MRRAASGAGGAGRARRPPRRLGELLAALGFAFLGARTQLTPAQVKDLKEPSEPKVRPVKPYPAMKSQSERLKKTQATQAMEDPEEDKVRQPRPKEPKVPKDYLPTRILTSFAQEVGSRKEQSRVAKVVAQDAVAQAKIVRDAEVSRAKAEYEKVRSQHKINTDNARLMQKLAESRYHEARKPQRSRWTWRALMWQAAERAFRPEMSSKRARSEFELMTRENLGTPFRRVWGWE